MRDISESRKTSHQSRMCTIYAWLLWGEMVICPQLFRFPPARVPVVCVREKAITVQAYFFEHPLEDGKHILHSEVPNFPISTGLSNFKLAPSN